MNSNAFFQTLRGSKQFPALTTRQVQGIQVLIDVWAQWYAIRYPIEYLIAALAQVGRETGYRMYPVMETFASTAGAAAQTLERAYLKGQLPWVKQRYWLADKDGLIWIGRGGIQITHKTNYAKLAKEIGETYDIDLKLDEDPELAMDPVVAAVIVFEGMTKGLFTGKKLDDFYKNGKMDWAGQRAIVNGDFDDKDIQSELKSNAHLFEKAFEAAGPIEASTERNLPGMVKPTATPGETLPVQPVKDKGKERVILLQSRLIAHGYGDIVGKADGYYGPKTAKGVEAFESSKNIKLDHVDAATWEALIKQAAGEKQHEPDADHSA